MQDKMAVKELINSFKMWQSSNSIWGKRKQNQISHMRATGPTHSTILDLITLATFCDKYE
jgi:hypothetical protein